MKIATGKTLVIIIIIVMTTIMNTGCSDDSDSDITVGFNNPGSLVDGKYEKKPMVTNKAFNVHGESDSGENCIAIVYSGIPVATQYFGFAIVAPGFTLKIFFPNTETFEEGTTKNLSISPDSYNATITTSTDTYTDPQSTLNIDVTRSSTLTTDSETSYDTYEIVFTTNDVNINSLKTPSIFTISSGDTITAVKYPQ